MAGIEMVWRFPFEGEDVHLLRGVPTFAIEELLRFRDGTDLFDVATARQHGLQTIDFKPRLRIGGSTAGSYTALGLEVEAATGRIIAERDPPDPRIDHFFLDIEATIAGRATAEQRTLLVWLHGGVEAAWMTPSPITVPRGFGTARSMRRPTILARFDDDVIGVVTGHPGGGIQPAPPLELDATHTSVAAPPGAALGATVPLIAILPAGLAGLAAEGEAVIGPAWEELSAEQRTVESLGVSSATAADADGASANVLVLADGIPDPAEQLGLAQGLATSLRRMRPYSWMYDRLQLWHLPLASRQTGGAVQWMSDTEDGPPRPVVRPTVPPASGPWTVGNLVHVAGPALPVPAGGWPALADQLDRWSVQLPFDAAELAERVDQATYEAWRAQTIERVPVNERDTALGVVQGLRTATNAPPGTRGGARWRDLLLGPGRMSRSEINRLLGLLLDRTGVPMGDRWTTGEDRRLVVVLSGGHAGIGNYLSEPQLVIMAVEASGEAPRLTARADGRGSEVSAAQWPVDAAATSSANRLRGRFAHELGHAFGLGDEYGGEHLLPASRVQGTETYANLQAEAGPSGLSDGTALRGDRLRWNHLRIARAFLLRESQPILEVLEDSADPPHDIDGRVAYRLQLQPGQLQAALDDGFDLEDGTHPALFLRTRRLLTDTLDSFELSPEVELIEAEPFSDLVYVRERVAGTFDRFRVLVARLRSRSHPAVLFAPVPKAAEADGFARLLPKLVRDHLTASGRPLDAPSLDDEDAWTCPAQGNDSSWPKMRNRPPLRKGKPFFAARRVPAVWTGGMVFDCGIFHPTAHSIMRGSTVRALEDPGEQDVFVSPSDVPLPDTGEPGEFDAVASYLLIDRLDPSQHHQLERVIALRDPD